LIHIKSLRSIEALNSIRDDWDGLLNRSLNETLFLSWDWISHWMSVYLENQNLLCLAVYNDDKLVGLAPFWVQQKRLMGFGSLKVLRLVGTEEICSDHLNIIVARKNSDAICSAVWDHLYGTLRSDWDIFEYNNVPSDSSVLHSLYRLAENDDRCLAAVITEYTICPYIILPETWDQFAKSISADQKRDIKYSEDLLAKAGVLKLNVCDSIAEFPQFMKTHIDLHRKSWKDRGHSGSFNTERFRKFHNEFAQDILSKGKLLLCTLELNDVPIGSFYGFEYNKVMHYYLIGVDRSAVPKTSIGRVLVGRCIKIAIERGCREFDFLRGFEDYKYDWTDSDRREWCITFYNRSVRTLVYILDQFACRYFKQVGKLVLGNKTVHVRAWLAKAR
jgi:CelD/BcsL family acetyltransferase involved in cellulose biosynthesis